MTNKFRMANFELLRVWAMVLIITSHIVAHTINVQLFDAKYSIIGELFNNHIVYKSLIIVNGK